MKAFRVSPLPVAKSLRARMTFAFTAWSFLIALIASAFFVGWSYRTAERDIRERVHAAARLVKLEWESFLPKRDAARAIREAKEDMRLDNVALFVVDASGNVMATNRGPTLSVNRLRRGGWLSAEAHSGDVTIVAGMDWRAAEAVIRNQALVYFACVLMIGAAGGFAAWSLVGSTLRPIGILAEEAGSASGDPLHARLRAPSDDAEVRDLVSTLNGFLARFQESTRAREQFYAAAAHELRTPLAVLSGNIELALSRPRTASDYVETLRDLQVETRRLITLAEGLLTLNRLQTNIDGEETERVDISEECARILAALQPRILARRLTVAFDADADDSETLAVRSHVVMLLRNLIENAVKFASPGGNVRIRVDADDRHVRLVVQNDFEDAPGLPFDRIDEPFFRADSSRSQTTGGNGLGLAICRQLADAHGWRLRHAATNDGVQADVAFPRAAGSNQARTIQKTT